MTVEINRSDPIALLESALADLGDVISILRAKAKIRRERCYLCEKVTKAEILLEEVVSALELERDERSKGDAEAN